MPCRFGLPSAVRGIPFVSLAAGEAGTRDVTPPDAVGPAGRTGAQDAQRTITSEINPAALTQRETMPTSGARRMKKALLSRSVCTQREFEHEDDIQIKRHATRQATRADARTESGIEARVRHI